MEDEQQPQPDTVAPEPQEADAEPKLRACPPGMKPDASLYPYLQMVLRNLESHFALPVLYNGQVRPGVDLLAMRERLSESAFRDYLDLRRGVDELYKELYQ